MKSVIQVFGHITCAVILSILVIAVSTAGERPEIDYTPKLTSFLTKVIELFEIPGLALTITRGKEVLYTGAFGVRNIHSQLPITPDSIFHMASVSKPFVATAIVQLVEQGKIDLDAPLVTYLPYFKLDDKRYQDITIRQMLTHTSGMGDVIDYQWNNPQYDAGAAERYVRSLADTQLVASPGESWRYSNIAYDVLGDVIAKVSGQSFEHYVEKRILWPLGMSQSTFLWKQTNPAFRTSPHIWRIAPVVSEVYPYNRQHAPSSTLNSTISEMAYFAMANLNGGELNGVRVLREESYKLLWAPSIEISESRQQGLSWFVDTYRGLKTLGHGGSDLGFRSTLMLIPEKDLGVVIASNYFLTPVNDIRDGVLDILLGYVPNVPKPHAALSFSKVYIEQGLEAAQSHYLRLKSEAAGKYAFGSKRLNYLAYVFLEDDRMDAAIDVFHFNLQAYPDAEETYGYLAAAYRAYGDVAAAVRTYRELLSADPQNKIATRMLRELGADNE